MKIGIVTQPLATNYGGILQNYALQQVLKKLGHEVWTIDYNRFNWLDWADNAWRVLVHKMLGHDVKFAPAPEVRRQKEAPLRKFVHDHISLTVPRTKKFSSRILDKYSFDAVVVGSDQVWRPIYNYDVADCFLKFAGSRPMLKVAYAASFGTSGWELSARQTAECARLVKSFKGVSVRELSGIKLCREHLDADAVNVLDPTLLLHAEDYTSLCRNVPKHEPFVFAYILDGSEAIRNTVKSFAESKGLPYFVKSAGANVGPDDSVESWLSYFRDARYVITDSFHGTVFSIIFNKEFVVLGNEQRGNSRFDSLLDILGLEGRMISRLNQTKSDNIDWKAVNARREESIAYSVEWLKHTLR